MGGPALFEDSTLLARLPNDSSFSITQRLLFKHSLAVMKGLRDNKQLFYSVFTSSCYFYYKQIHQCTQMNN